MWRSFLAECRNHPFYLASFALLGLSAFFLVLPQIDPWVSAFFYDPEHGFWLKYEAHTRFIRRLGILVPRLMVLAMALFLIARLFWPRLKRYASLQRVLFLATTAILGPGLLVNLILKAHWGRARPIQTDLFGGQWPFSEVWVIAGNCQSNCSFVSGEGSMAFWMLATLILVPKASREALIGVMVVFTATISINRIAFGGHYFSDIVLSWALTGYLMLAVYLLYQRYAPEVISGDNLEKAWDKAGAWLRHKAGR